MLVVEDATVAEKSLGRTGGRHVMMTVRGSVASGRNCGGWRKRSEMNARSSGSCWSGSETTAYAFQLPGHWQHETCLTEKTW